MKKKRKEKKKERLPTENKTLGNTLDGQPSDTAVGMWVWTYY